MSSSGGPEYYFGVAGGHDAFVVDEATLQDVLRKLASAQRIDFPYSRASYLPATPAHHKPLPPRLVELSNISAARNRQVVKEKQLQTTQEMKEAQELEVNLKNLKKKLGRELAQQQDTLEAKLKLALDAVASERRDRSTMTGLLLGATALGVAISLLYSQSWVFPIFGGLVATMFATWLAIYRYLALRSPGEQEVATIQRGQRHAQIATNQHLRSAIVEARHERHEASQARKAALQNLQNEAKLAARAYQVEFSAELARCRDVLRMTEQSVTQHENRWGEIANTYREKRSRIEATIVGLADEGRMLASNYQRALLGLKARSEEAARIRHMRLHLIADADIAQVGAGRKQLLASNGIFTAADVDELRIRDIRGFKNVLTNNLLAWKLGVLRQFHFDPATAVSQVEQRAIILTFRSAQQQILEKLRRETKDLETLAPTCRSALEDLIPSLRHAVAQYSQAEVDLQFLDGKR